MILSILEIYNESVNDLLNLGNNVKIKEDKRRGVNFENITQAYIGSKDEMYNILDQIHERKSLTDIKNDSHTVFLLKLIQKFPDDSSRNSLLTVVDLAAIEKVYLYI